MTACTSSTYLDTDMPKSLRKFSLRGNTWSKGTCGIEWQLRLALLLVDCRIAPTPDDVLMKEWLDYYNIDNAVV